MRAPLLPGIIAACTLVAGPARAQAPLPCDRLAGVERQLCLERADQLRREKERLGREEEEKLRSCDRLPGQEKEACLKRGGTVRAAGER